MRHSQSSFNNNIKNKFNSQPDYRQHILGFRGDYSFEMGGKTHYFDDRDEYLRAFENYLRVQRLQELNHGRVSEEMINDIGFDLEEAINDSDKEDWTPAGGEDYGDVDDKYESK